MNGTSIPRPHQFLDISELVLQEHSPCFKPFPRGYDQQPLEIHDFDLDSSPSVDQILIGAIPELQGQDLEFANALADCYGLYDLQGMFGEDPPLEVNVLGRSKKHKKGPSSSDYEIYELFNVENDLENIFGSALDFEFFPDEYQDYDYQNDFQEVYQSDVATIENQEVESEENKDEINSTNSYCPVLEKHPLHQQWDISNPKKELISKLKAVSHSSSYESEEAKIQEIKAVVESYIFDFEKYYFHESMNSVAADSVSVVLATLIRGVEQTFKRVIGGLSFEKRRMKLLKYMDKKSRRDWKKKVNYDCRKKVADGRLRIKGKFVTYDQACEQLGRESLDGLTMEDVKTMLENKV